MTNTVTGHVGHALLCTALEGGVGYWARAYNIETVETEDSFLGWEYASVDLVEWEDAMVECGVYSYDILDDLVDMGDSRISLHRVTADDLLLTFRRAITGEDEALNKAIGMQRIMRWAIRSHEDKVMPDLDAEDADVLVQVHIFGEIVYG